MKRFVVCWRQHRYGISRIALELIGDRQFLAEPDDAFGLGLAEMMNNEHGYTCEDYQREQIWRKTAIRSNPKILESPSRTLIRIPYWLAATGENKAELG
jgi:hypothetical protein